MNFRTNFREKLLLLAVAPLAVALFVTLFAVTRTVEQDVHARARDSLRIGARVVDEYLSSRSDQLRTSVEVLAADFGLKQAVATSDPDSIRSALQNHSRRVGADMALTLTLDGGTIASTFGSAHATRPDFGDLVGDANSVASYQSTTLIDGDVYQTFAVPLRAPIPIAWVVLGFRIDDSIIERVASLTGLDVALIASTGENYRLISSGKADRFGSHPERLLKHDGPSRRVYLVNSRETDFLATAAPFAIDATNSADVTVVLLRSMNDAMAPYVEARRVLIIFGAVLLIVVAVIAAWVSGSIAKPLHRLTGAARNMMSGKYDVVVQVTSNDEVGELASSFDAMRTAIADREQRISHQALHDPVTDLPNRSYMIEHLTRILEDAKQNGNSTCVLLIRLSRMDAISSTLGHSAGDELITRVAQHLRANVHDSEILGHVGTNEFALILRNAGLDDALTCAEKLRAILDAGVTLGRVNISMQTETGIAGFPQHGDNAADLFRNAAIARSEARLRNEPVAIFEQGRDDFHVRQLRIVNDLRGAVHRRELQVWYQPKVSLPDGCPCGAEALVRWQHPEYGWLSPDEFVPVAEEAGTIVHLTRHVLQQAIGQCRNWQDQGFRLQVSVNISARDLCDDYLPYYVSQLLQAEALEPHRLTLEVTENSIMRDIQRAATVLECLRDLGIRVSMDDFGTGQSSLAQLQNLPLHELKIDKSFVMNVLENDGNEAIVRTTLELAHNFRLSVVAEGVEDEPTIRFLSKAGCEQAQGYFLSKPISSDDFLHWLRSRKTVAYEERRAHDGPLRHASSAL